MERSKQNGGRHCITWSQEKLDKIKDVTDALTTYLNILNEIAKGTSESKACKDANVDLRQFRRVYQTKIAGYKPLLTPDLPEDSVLLMDTKYPFSTWQELMYMDLIGERDICKLPPDVDESIEYVLGDAISKSIITERQYDILMQRYQDCLSLREIGRKQHVDRQRIHQLVEDALRTLRQPRYYKILIYGMEWYRKFEEVRNDTYQSEHKTDFKQLEKELERAIYECDRENVIRVFTRAKVVLQSDFQVDPYHVQNGKFYPLDTELDEMNLTSRAYNVLRRAGCVTIGDVLNIPVNKLRYIRNMGVKTEEEIQEKMKEMGYTMFRSQEDLEMYKEAREEAFKNDTDREGFGVQDSAEPDKSN